MKKTDPDQATKPSSSRRSKAEADQESLKRTQAWDLAARGVPQAHIARQLEVSERTVGRWLDAQRQAIVRHLQKTRHEYLVDNLAAFEAIGSEAWRRLVTLKPENDRANSAQLLRLVLSVMRDRVALEDRLIDSLGENEGARSEPFKFTFEVDGPPIRRDPVEISPEVIRENSRTEASGPDALARYGLEADGALEVGKIELDDDDDDDDEDERSPSIPLSEWTGPLSEWIRQGDKENS